MQEDARGCKRHCFRITLSPPEFFGVNFGRLKISPETFSKFGQMCTRKTKFSRNSQFQMTKEFVEKKNSLISTSLESLIF
jgi:hypothetical protein